jgi:hypothetical protein
MAVNRTIWDTDTFSKLPISSSTMTIPHFEVKDYLVTSKGDPTFTKTFPEPVFMRLEESSQFTNGVGIHVGVAMSSFALRESQGALWSPEMVLKQEAAAKQVALGRIEALTAELAKAVEALREALYFLKPTESDMEKKAGIYRIVTTLAEIEGGMRNGD